MIIRYRNAGGIAESDRFMGMKSCCHEMSMVVLKNSQVQITKEGNPYLLPSRELIKYCPFCGEGVEKVNICSPEEMQETKKEVDKTIEELRGVTSHRKVIP